MLADLPDNWQHRDIAAALGFVRGFRLAVDGGAHRGTVTAQLLRRFQRVVAIEPGPLAERIPYEAQVIRAALGDKPGRCGMQDGTSNTGERHCIEGDAVEVITLDSLNLAPDFVKLDVEGWEYFALKGGEQTIRTHRPVVMLEEKGHELRYGLPERAGCLLMESWGARLVHQTRSRDWVYAW